MDAFASGHLSWLLTNFRWVLEVQEQTSFFIVWIGFCEPQSE